MFIPSANHRTNRPWSGGRGTGVAANGMGQTSIRPHRSKGGKYLKTWGSRPEYKRREVRRAV